MCFNPRFLDPQGSSCLAASKFGKRSKRDFGPKCLRESWSLLKGFVYCTESLILAQDERWRRT